MSKNEWYFEELKPIYQRLQEAYQAFDQFYETIAPLRSQAMGLGLTELADLNYVLENLEQTHLAIVKEIAAVKRQFITILVAGWVQRSLTEGAPEPVRGRLATASPDVKKNAKLPSFGTNEYAALMRHLGVPDKLIADDRIKPDFKAVQNYLQKALAEGKNVAGIDPTQLWTESRLSFRGKKVDLRDRAEVAEYMRKEDIKKENS